MSSSKYVRSIVTEYGQVALRRGRHQFQLGLHCDGRTNYHLENKTINTTIKTKPIRSPVLPIFLH